MTLTRPAYTARVENVDAGWSDSVTAGETFDPNAGLWLADGLKMAWRFSGPPPAQLEPEVVSFALLADGIANLPDFIEGDRIAVTLERPTLSTPIPYMEFAGRITDLKLTTDAEHDRLLLIVTAVDPTSELTHNVNIPIPADANIVWGAHVTAIINYTIAGVYSDESRWLNTAVMTGSSGALEFVARACNAGLNPIDGYPVQRYAAGPITDPDFTYEAFVVDPVWNYYLAQWLPALSGELPVLFEYAWSPADGDQVSVVATADPLDPDSGSVTVLDACYMPDLADWRKDRTASPNQIIVTGKDTVTGEDATPVTAHSTAAIERYGAITRTIDSMAAPNQMVALAARYLALMPSNAADSWLFDSTTLLTEQMDDATLDAYAPLFWTVREPVPGVMGRLCVLAGVDPDVDPSGGYLVAHLAGVTFEAADGKLAITPELVPAALPTVVGGADDSPTFDEFGASVFGAAKFHDPGGSGDYIDPDLTFDKAKFTSL